MKKKILKKKKNNKTISDKFQQNTSNTVTKGEELGSEDRKTKKHKNTRQKNRNKQHPKILPLRS